jgi:hypothetical protein
MLCEYKTGEERRGEEKRRAHYVFKHHISMSTLISLFISDWLEIEQI